MRRLGSVFRNPLAADADRGLAEAAGLVAGSVSFVGRESELSAYRQPLAGCASGLVASDARSVGPTPTEACSSTSPRPAGLSSPSASAGGSVVADGAAAIGARCLPTRETLPLTGV